MRKIQLFTPLAAMLLLAGCDLEINGMDSEKFQKDFRYSYPLKAGATFRLETMNGSVDIAGWDRNEVEITGVQFAKTEALRDQIKIEIEHSDRAVSVRTVAPSAPNSGAGARYVVRLPRTVTLDLISTSNSKIHADNIDGTVRLKTSNGQIQLSKVKGNAEAQTSNGAVEATELGGLANLHTSNSRITADNVRGPVDATTANGSITLTLTAGLNGAIRAHTSNGSITVKLPTSAAARVRASTSNGHISSAFESSDQDRGERSNLQGSINGGSASSPLLDLTTSNGSVRIEKL